MFPRGVHFLLFLGLSGSIELAQYTNRRFGEVVRVPGEFSFRILVGSFGQRGPSFLFSFVHSSAPEGQGRRRVGGPPRHHGWRRIVAMGFPRFHAVQAVGARVLSRSPFPGTAVHVGLPTAVRRHHRCFGLQCDRGQTSFQTDGVQRFALGYGRQHPHPIQGRCRRIVGVAGREHFH